MNVLRTIQISPFILLQLIPVTNISTHQFTILNPHLQQILQQLLSTSFVPPLMLKTPSSELLFKIIVIGESATGKSCLMLRYIKDEFQTKYNLTVGVEFASKKIEMDDSYSVKLQIWDTAGQESFRSIVRNFYRNCSAVFLVYNITKRKSFGALNSWLKQARENSPKNVMFVLVGTHLDQVEENPSAREVEKEEAERWMVKQGISLFFETSAKSNANITEAFKQTASQLFINYVKSRKSSASILEKMMEEINLLQAKPSVTESVKHNKCC